MDPTAIDPPQSNRSHRANILVSPEGDDGTWLDNNEEDWLRNDAQRSTVK